MNKTQTQAQKAYARRVEERMPKSPVLLHTVFAFISGGLICALGQGVSQFGKDVLMLDKEGVSAFTAIVMVFIGAFLTGLGVYDKIGRYAGAGSIVPITGFANSIVSPAMEFKREGHIMGLGAKMFTVAGPVLVFGIAASVIVGILQWILKG